MGEKVCYSGAEFSQLSMPDSKNTSSHSASGLLLRVGLAGASEFESIEVLWADGSTERFPGGSADRELVLHQGEGRP